MFASAAFDVGATMETPTPALELVATFVFRAARGASSVQHRLDFFGVLTIVFLPAHFPSGSSRTQSCALRKKENI